MYVIRNRKTKDYQTNNSYIVTNDLKKARVFNYKNCGGYLTQSGKNKEDYEILELEIRIKDGQ